MIRYSIGREMIMMTFQGLVMARCKKQVQNGHIQYAFINASPATTTPVTTYGGDFKKFIHSSLTLSDVQQDFKS